MAEPPACNAPEASCLDSVFLVSCLRDDVLSPDDHERLKLHLATCPRCRVASHQFQVLFQSLDVFLARTEGRSASSNGGGLPLRPD